jgi:uncharacterized protein YbjT (DUF2867 family)
MTRIALVAGPTGLIGALLLTRLLADPGYREVRALSRRPLGARSPKLKTLITDYADLGPLGDALAVDDVFCCLGTTIKTAGSREAFERVDYGMVLEVARAARARGAKQFLVVSAAGTSDKGAFYSRVKAKMERDVAALGYPSVHIVRPSLLLGSRSESRPGEQVAQLLTPLLSPLMRGPLLKYRPVQGAEVADALITLARRDQPGTHIHHLPLRDQPGAGGPGIT